MPSQLPKPRRRAPRWPLLLATGLGLGTLGGLYAERAIERAGAGGLFGPPPLPPSVAPAAQKVSEEDRIMGAALAAALGADAPADCHALDSRHQRGCRDYLASRSRGDELFDSSAIANQAALDRAERASAFDWPATFD